MRLLHARLQVVAPSVAQSVSPFEEAWTRVASQAVNEDTAAKTNTILVPLQQEQGHMQGKRGTDAVAGMATSQYGGPTGGSSLGYAQSQSSSNTTYQSTWRSAIGCGK